MSECSRWSAHVVPAVHRREPRAKMQALGAQQSSGWRPVRLSWATPVGSRPTTRDEPSLSPKRAFRRDLGDKPHHLVAFSPDVEVHHSIQMSDFIECGRGNTLLDERAVCCACCDLGSWRENANERMRRTSKKLVSPVRVAGRLQPTISRQPISCHHASRTSGRSRRASSHSRRCGGPKSAATARWALRWFETGCAPFSLRRRRHDGNALSRVARDRHECPVFGVRVRLDDDRDGSIECPRHKRVDRDLCVT